MESTGTKTRQASLRQRSIIFSVILFLLIFIGGSVVFVLSMLQIVRTNTGQELTREVEIEKIKLEASVNAEIAIALKMADSPIIQTYFMNPNDPALEQIAFREIAGYRRAFSGNRRSTKQTTPKRRWGMLHLTAAFL